MARPNLIATLLHLLQKNWVFLVGLFVGALLPLLVFGTLWGTIHKSGFWWDDAILRGIHRYSSASLDRIVVDLTILGGLLALPVLVSFALVLRFLMGQPRTAFFFATSVSGSWALNIVAKIIFHRVRPSLWASPLAETDYSFPSGHAMVSMALASTFVLLAWNTRFRWPTVFCAVVGVLGIGLSRLYLGVHYPSDILAGWCASLNWVRGVDWITWRGRRNIRPFKRF